MASVEPPRPDSAELDRPAIKVVPYFIDERPVGSVPIDPRQRAAAPDVPGENTDSDQSPWVDEGAEPVRSDSTSRRTRGGWLGVAAFAIAVGAALACGIGVGVASNGSWTLATGLAYAGVGFSVIAVVLGLFAVFADLGRRFGTWAVIIGVLANPIVLLALLRAVSAIRVG